MIRLHSELLERLKQLAAHDNRSLNNYVETILMDVIYNILKPLALKTYDNFSQNFLKKVVNP